jgi:ER lumen protein retaining receptor
MNLFRMAGDLMHLLSICILIFKIRRTKSVSGLSLHTQVLYMIVFMTRYLDLFFHYISLYNTLMKLIFIGTSAYIIYLMKVVYRKGYEKQSDFIRVEYLLVPCAVLSLIFHHRFTPLEVSLIILR